MKHLQLMALAFCVGYCVSGAIQVTCGIDSTARLEKRVAALEKIRFGQQFALIPKDGGPPIVPEDFLGTVCGNCRLMINDSVSPPPKCCPNCGHKFDAAIEMIIEPGRIRFRDADERPVLPVEPNEESNGREAD